MKKLASAPSGFMVFHFSPTKCLNFYERKPKQGQFWLWWFLLILQNDGSTCGGTVAPPHHNIQLSNPLAPYSLMKIVHVVTKRQQKTSVRTLTWPLVRKRLKP